ncbi:hypothetical protein MBLNU459_g6846t2 [Dothideomycetes sp. NU459]
MPFRVALADESDVPAIARLDEAAMKDNGITQAIGIALVSEGVPRSEFFMTYIRGAFPKDAQSFWKVVDTETGEIVSVAWFSFDHGDSKPSPAPNEGQERPQKQPSEQLKKTMGTLFGDWKDFAAANASSAGFHVYERFGFKAMRTDYLDLAELGVDRVEKLPWAIVDEHSL